MATVVLGSLGAAVGGVLGGPLGAAVGRFAGAFGGRYVDQRLFTTTMHGQSSGLRLRELAVQTNSYGLAIPVIFGTVRVAGNIIWARPLVEMPSIQTYKSSGKGQKVRHTRTEYAYFASFAVSICEGEIDEILRIYAGARQINPVNYNIRIYRGTEEQLPDPLIESFEGVGRTPAFRGQAYVVFDNFPLAEFGNVIPNFNFEVRRSVQGNSEHSVGKLVESVVMIPGGGEYVYDTISQYKAIGTRVGGAFYRRGKLQSLNHHSNTNSSNALLALDDLQRTLPAAGWVSVVVSWFGTSLNIADCAIHPGVEYNDAATENYPDAWCVAGRGRQQAYIISQTNGRPNYGGTINDASLVRYVEELKKRGFKVMLYPMIFMDLPGKPWRGHISGSASDVHKFFHHAGGYNEFIMHYCNLMQGKVDAFIIGSELRSLTAIRAADGSFPAVGELIELARMCKSTMGPTTLLTYAADWSEYHHSDGGWYHLDPLWASDDIDMVGIDAYFPLSNSAYSIYDIDAIKSGWQSGEGFDFYYEDDAKTIAKPLDAPYAWKNLVWWWESYHTNPDGSMTQWRPRSKKIWFTEYGFPSVDCCTNQPNVFFDPANPNASYPLKSRGMVDFKAQSQAIIATELFWHNSVMVERKFLWCWDARPYPLWPDSRAIWSDGECWQKGHWVQGKVATSTLGGILEELSRKVDLQPYALNFAHLGEGVEGLVIDSQSTARSIIELLQKIYQFDVVEQGEQICFVGPHERRAVVLRRGELAKVDKMPLLTMRRIQESELPRQVDINYIDQARGYQISNQHALKATTMSRHNVSYEVGMVMSQGAAKLAAERCLHSMWVRRTIYTFYLPPRFLHLKVGDLVKLRYGKRTHNMKVVTIRLGSNCLLQVEAVSNHKFKKRHEEEVRGRASGDVCVSVGQTNIEVLDLPYLPKYAPNESYVLLGARSTTENWSGATIYTSLREDSDYEPLCYVDKLATFGHILYGVAHALSGLVDYKSRVIVNMEHGSLYSVTADKIALGANLCVMGDELVQFQTAKQIDENQYELSVLYRGVHGTQWAMCSHKEGERFILVDDNLVKLDMQSAIAEWYIKAVSDGATLASADAMRFEYRGNCQKLFAPVWLTLDKLCGGKSVLRWVRCNRYDGQLRDFGDIPPQTYFEKYLVKLIDKFGKILAIHTVDERQIVLEDDVLEECGVIQVCQLDNNCKEGFYGLLPNFPTDSVLGEIMHMEAPL